MELDLDIRTRLLHDTDCYAYEGGFRRQQVWSLYPSVGPGSTKVRATVYRANTDVDSSYVAEVWTATGWAECVRIVGVDPRFTEEAGMPPGRFIAYHPNEGYAFNRNDCDLWSRRVLETLVSETSEILD